MSMPKTTLNSILHIGDSTRMWTYLNVDYFKIRLMISINAKVKIYILI